MGFSGVFRKQAGPVRSILVFDTKTTGLPKRVDASVTAVDMRPRLVQLAWVLMDTQGAVLGSASHIIRPDGFEIPADAARIHGITTERALRLGDALPDVLAEFSALVDEADLLVAHDMEPNAKVVSAEFARAGASHHLDDVPKYCTMKQTAAWCRVSRRGARWEWPTLEELHMSAVGKRYRSGHDAASDAMACAACVRALIERGVIDVDRILRETPAPLVCQQPGAVSDAPTPESVEPVSREFTAHRFFRKMVVPSDPIEAQELRRERARLERRIERLEAAKAAGAAPRRPLNVRDAEHMPAPMKLAEDIDEESRRPLLRRHFELAKQIHFWYARRRDHPNALYRAIVMCEQQIALAPQAFAAVVAEFGRSQSHAGYHQLAVIREKQGHFAEALRLAREAQAQGWLDLTDDWSARIARLEKCLAKSQRKQSPTSD
jgi:DNA polymerase III epsilon subunit-like protein